ncbi:MAG: hypothetical protein IPJ74_24735 [Saprospiraceae bacterium]|nr:hypothetical protein [Saprospiraceae bacterium]
MGNRADTKSFVQTKQKNASSKRNSTSGTYELKAFLIDNDIEYDDETVIRREILPSGKSRAFINDSPVNLNVLQQLSRRCLICISNLMR